MTRQRDLLDEMLDAYIAWREECVSVHDRYRWSQTAPEPDDRLAYVAYRAALEREEQAANVYERVLERVKSEPYRLHAIAIDA
jgi:hypothetical protein